MDSSTLKKNQTREDQLIELISPLVAPLGYEIVHVEVQNQRQKILRIFIDFKDSDQAVGIEDCVRVTKALDEPLDQIPEIEKLFSGPYELEVSSPGVDRPLRTNRDYERFAGREVRIHVYRPLTAEELENGDYQAKNPKQKNFLGTLKGVRNEKVLLAISLSGDVSKVQKKGKKAAKEREETENRAPTVLIPLPLISKANLMPVFEIGDEK